MSAIDAWTAAYLMLVTTLTVQPADPAAAPWTLWQRPGAHMTECGVLAADPHAFARRLQTGDRLFCSQHLIDPEKPR